MRRFARRLSQIAQFNVSNKDVPSVVLHRPSSASIFQFEEDQAYFKNLGLRTTAPQPANGNGALLSAPSRIAKNAKKNKANGSTNGSSHDLSDVISVTSFPTLEISSVAGLSYNLNDEAAQKEHHKKENFEQLARTSRFLSIMYAFLLIITGAMCSLVNINAHSNFARDIFFIIISLMSIGWLGFLHFDILKYKRWALKIVKPYVNGDVEIKMEDYDDDGEEGGNEGDDEDGGRDENNNGRISTISKSNHDAYDSVSLNTAMIFDYVQKPKPRRQRSNFDSISMASFGGTVGGAKNGIETGYRYFQGKHSNDFYLKTGMIIFSFGSIMHLGIQIVQEAYFFLHKDETCQDSLKLTTNCVRVFFSFYQLFIAFKYSNIIINRYQNLARFALMHLLGTSISIWLDTITDEVIEDYVSRKLGENMTEPDAFESMLETYDQPFREHLIHTQNCSRLAIVSNQSMSALPYLYPFTIEFNIAIASVWYMIWTNIGKVNDKSLFHSVKEEVVEDEDGNEQVQLKSTGLSMNVDCHASNRGLFLGLALLLVIVITIVIFFSTIKNDVYSHFSMATYSLQLAILTLCCFIVIPLAYVKIQRLDVVNAHHRDNAFTIMDDILVLLPIPFYFVHYSLSIIANILDTHEPQFERANNLLLSVIDLFTIAQVMIQSPFIVDGLRRCANNPKVRYRKPGRELIIFALILNVTLWILNTFELKSVEVHHASHHYYGEFASMIMSHATVPIMLFYRFHSSVCLSNIWKYAYEKDE